jgi:hypothetical protein
MNNRARLPLDPPKLLFALDELVRRKPADDALLIEPRLENYD